MPGFHNPLNIYKKLKTLIKNDEGSLSSLNIVVVRRVSSVGISETTETFAGNLSEMKQKRNSRSDDDFTPKMAEYHP